MLLFIVRWETHFLHWIVYQLSNVAPSK